MTLESPRWQAVGLVLDQNTRDVLAKRFGILQDAVSWFKGIEIFRQAELAHMIERKPTATDKRYHKTWLTALIAEVYAHAAVEEREEALAVALRDCESALICYRLLSRCAIKTAA